MDGTSGLSTSKFWNAVSTIGALPPRQFRKGPLYLDHPTPPSIPQAPFSPVTLPPAPGGICFSDRNFVQVLRRSDDETLTSSSVLRTIPMSELTIGDYVPSGKENFYTRVISFCHRNHRANATFMQIHLSSKGAEGSNATSTTAYPLLEMSADHLVRVRRPNAKKAATWMRAADVQVGDVLFGALEEPHVVVQIEEVSRTGVFAPITESGTPLVSGAVVSSYVATLQSQPKHSSPSHGTKQPYIDDVALVRTPPMSAVSTRSGKEIPLSVAEERQVFESKQRYTLLRKQRTRDGSVDRWQNFAYGVSYDSIFIRNICM